MRKTVARLLVGGSILVPVIAGLSLFTVAAREPASAEQAAAPGALTIKSARGKCGMCHREIAQEWLNSMHSRAFQDAHFTQAMKDAHAADSDCFRCHAPQAVRAKGLGQTPEVRTDMQEVGVDCVVCHTNLQGKVHAPFKSAAAPHDVEVDPQHATEVLCASCHATFGTVGEFKQTSYAKEGQTCQTCHMPKVKRPVATGGEPKMVAQHLWKGGDDPEMLKKALKFDAAVSADGTVTAHVANAGAGHKFPTGIQYHQAALAVTVTDASGKELFSKRDLIADLTKSGGADTRINPGETRTFTVPTGVKAGSFSVQLLYKVMPNTEDKDATVAASTTAKL